MRLQGLRFVKIGLVTEWEELQSRGGSGEDVPEQKNSNVLSANLLHSLPALDHKALMFFVHAHL